MSGEVTLGISMHENHWWPGLYQNPTAIST